MKVLLTLVILIFSSFQLQAIETIHGMVIFGKNKLYAYHLPMFHQIHNKQLIFNFEVPSEIQNKIAELEDAQYLTFVPAPFDLDKFIENPFALKGDLYSGHFEKNGVIVMKGLILSKPTIIFNSSLTNDHMANEVYQIFGSGDQMNADYYALHVVSQDSLHQDQLLKIKPTFFPMHADSYFMATTLIKKDETYNIDYPHPVCHYRACPWDFNINSIIANSVYFEDEVM